MRGEASLRLLLAVAPAWAVRQAGRGHPRAAAHRPTPACAAARVCCHGASRGCLGAALVLPRRWQHRNDASRVGRAAGAAVGRGAAGALVAALHVRRVPRRVANDGGVGGHGGRGRRGRLVAPGVGHGPHVGVGARQDQARLVAKRTQVRWGARCQRRHEQMLSPEWNGRAQQRPPPGRGLAGEGIRGRRQHDRRGAGVLPVCVFSKVEEGVFIMQHGCESRAVA